MPISITCPSCDRGLKVKDELAGRKIKCPQCAEIIVVRDQREAGKAASMKNAPRTKAEPEEEEEDEEDRDERPREKKPGKKKRKKKKAKSNNGLLIGGAIGGLVLVIVVVLVIVFATGDKSKESTSSDQAKQPNAERDRSGSRAEGPGRVLELTRTNNLLKQLALALNGWYDQEKRGPNNASELSKYYENSPRLNELLANNRITVIWGVSKAKYSADLNQVLAYETQPDRNGIRLVARAYGMVEQMNEAEFQAALAGKGN